MPFTAPPVAPDRNRPSTFSSDTAAFLDWMTVVYQEWIAATPGDSAVSLALSLGSTDVAEGSAIPSHVPGQAYRAGSVGAYLERLRAGTSTADGDYLVAVKSVVAGAIATTQHEVNGRTLSVLDLMTDAQRDDVKAGALTLDVTSALQAAAVVATAAGYGVLSYSGIKAAKITGTLPILADLVHDLCNCRLVQYTDNTPIFSPGTSADVQRWGIREGLLKFNTQQTSSQTSGIGIRLANAKLSYNWFISDLQIEGACDSVASPATTGTFAFIGRLENIISNKHARWAMNIDCDSGAGANTNLFLVNCWSLQTSGSPIAGSKGFRFNALSMGAFVSLFADYPQGTVIEATNVDGWWGNVTVEAGTFVANNAQASVLQFSECSGRIENVKFVSNSFTASGSGELYLVRPTTSGTQNLCIGKIETANNTYTGGAAIFEVAPSSGMTITNEFAKLDRTVNLQDPNTYARRVTRWNGRPRHHKGTTAQRPTLDANSAGDPYLDTTLAAAGRLIIWTGTAWVDSTGTVV